jgi:hypothetical protein
MMKTTLALIALSLAACAADEAVDTQAREATVHEITPLELTPMLDEEGAPIAGTLELDTGEGRMDITHLIPLEPRKFESWDHFHEWAAKELNAKLVEYEGGVRQSLLAASFGPTVRFDAEKEDMVPVDDPISMIVGGPWGHVFVEDKLVCTSGTAECAKEQLVEPWRVFSARPSVASGSNNGLVASGSSRLLHLFFYHESSAITQLHTSQAWTTRTFWCGFFKWCTETVGSSSLTASFTAFRHFGSIFNGSQFATRNNVWSVAATHYAFGIAWGGWDDGTNMKPSVPNLGIVQQTSGMCSSHSASDGRGFVSLLTGTGDTGSGC